METDPGCGRLNKFSVQCTTRLVDYLGEHQSQVFYAGLSIDPIHTATGARAPIRIRIGQSVPMDLTDRHEKQEPESTSANLVLAMPIYFFKREYSVRAGNNPNPILKRTTHTTPDKSTEDSNEHQPCMDRVSVKCSVPNAQESPRTLVSLVTIIVYFPVCHMSSANNLCTATDQQKRFHLPPHPHEFVAYPNTITLPVEELGDRIVWGFQHIDTLFSKSLELPSELLQDHLEFHNELSVTSQTEPTIISNQTSDECRFKHTNEANKEPFLTTNQMPTFAVVSRDVYNRLCTIQRICAEGMKLTQLQKPTAILSRLWYSKVLSRHEPIEQRPVSPDRSPSAPNPLPAHPPISPVQTSPVSFLRWSGLRVSTGEPCPRVPAVDLSNLLNNGMSVAKLCRVVFVRRQSFDCSKVIDPKLLSIQFSPAKLRRTRVRGTIHCGIKLKRRCVNIDDFQPTPNDMDVGSCCVPPHAVVKRLCGENGSALCILTPNLTPGSRYFESPGWYTSFHSHTADDSSSPTNPLNSSIAARVKRGANVIPQIIQRPLQPRVDEDEYCLSPNQNARTDDLMNDVLIGPRNRAPPRRFDLTDQDLELALKRSLMEQTQVRKRKLENESGIEADTEQSPKNGHRRSEHIGKPIMRNGKRRRYMQKNARCNGTHNHRYKTVQSVRKNTTMTNVQYIMDKNDPEIKEQFSTLSSICDSKPMCTEEIKTSVEKYELNTALPTQGKEQLSCMVPNPPKFIPKLKLAKRRDGKFKILRLARKHIERKCAFKPRTKIQKQSPKYDVHSEVLDKLKKDSPQDQSQTSVVVSTLVQLSPEPQRNHVTNSSYLRPLNLITHTRSMNPIPNIEHDERCTLNKDLTLISVESQDFKDERSELPTNANAAEALSVNQNVPLFCDLKDPQAPLTMWTQLKTPLPAPEPHLPPAHSLTNSPTANSHIPTIQTNSMISAPSYLSANSPLESTTHFQYFGYDNLQKNQLSVSTNESLPCTLLNLNLPTGFDPTSLCKSNHFDVLSTSVNNSYNQYATMNCTKPVMEPFLPSPTSIGPCFPAHLSACANSVNGNLSGFEFPAKQHVQNTFHPPTTPLMLPSFVAPWPLPTCGTCNLSQETSLPLGSQPWNGHVVPTNNSFSSLTKTENANTMFFIQPTVPNMPYDCTLTTLTWPQPCEPNLWPVAPSYPSVQFIT